MKIGPATGEVVAAAAVEPIHSPHARRGLWCCCSETGYYYNCSSLERLCPKNCRHRLCSHCQVAVIHKSSSRGRCSTRPRQLLLLARRSAGRGRLAGGEWSGCCCHCFHPLQVGRQSLSRRFARSACDGLRGWLERVELPSVAEGQSLAHPSCRHSVLGEAVRTACCGRSALPVLSKVGWWWTQVWREPGERCPQTGLQLPSSLSACEYQVC